MVYWSDPAYEDVARLVSEHCGLQFGRGSAPAAEAATRRMMEKLGLAAADAYAARLKAGEASLPDLVDELVVGETWFFRQPSRFEFIRRQVIPDLVKRRPAGPLRAWSVGCSSGEEPYSLAILLEEAGVGECCQILATDISRAALMRAEQASYGIWSLRGMDESLVRRYFHRVGSREVLADRIRRRVLFRQGNLAAAAAALSPPAGRMDLVLCCNVLMYFDTGAIRRAAGAHHRSLADGGWLITGASDPSPQEHAPFDLVVTPHGVMYRRGAGREGGGGSGRADAPAPTGG